LNFILLKLLKIIFLAVFISGILYSCSQYKNTFVSRNFHNTTARYNAYFLAREKMKEVEFKINQASVDDYNKVLSVFPVIQDATKSTIKPDLDDVIKKAALINEKHKNSNWLDDGFVIIGKSDFYKGEYPSAIEFFKYVNSISKDPIPRHAALILLMRTFITMEDYDNASLVIDYLKKETPDKNNLRDLSLTQAYYYQKLEEYDKALENLNVALPLIKKGDQKARVHFIIGQINQMTGNDADAYHHYRSTLKNNPTYELSFYSRLFLAQVTELEKSNDKKKIQRYFKKLLKDKKNEEYKDKIYYEMAMFEMKQENVKKGIELFKKSIAASTNNNAQKGRAYLKLGEIYYDKEDFELSKLYYDSTVAAWDKKDKNYKGISSRQKILEEFVKQYQIVEREDSLQRLVKDTTGLSKYIDNIIARQEREKKEKEEREIKAKNDKNKAAANTGPAISANASWYFGNASAVAQGKGEFLKKWGNRKLEDNWRRSTKEVVLTKEEEKEETATNVPVKENKDEANAKARAAAKQKMYSDLPFTTEQMTASNKRYEEALYELGKIYNLKLHEKKNAIESFEVFLTKFYPSEKTPEVLYFLYLLFSEKADGKAATYKAKILGEFPRSLYAKILKNPNYLSESKISNKKAAEKYKQAYEPYQQEQYLYADTLLKLITIEFPDNDIEDKITFLRILITGKTKNAIVYKKELESFISGFPESPLVAKAQELLKVSQKFIANRTSAGDSIKTNEVRFSKDLIKPHYCVFMFFRGKVVPEKNLKDFDDYNKASKIAGVTTEIFNFNDTLFFVTVKTFTGKFTSENYLLDLTEKKSFLSNYGYTKDKGFIITKDNYQLLIQSKNINSYLNFFKENY
jgi:tetratricopeptide (TPR) repeat protein